MNKILPDVKPESKNYISIDLKLIETLKDLEDNQQTILQSVCEGRLTMDEGERLFGLLQHRYKVKEAVEIGEEIQEVKQFIKEHKSKR